MRNARLLIRHIATLLCRELLDSNLVRLQECVLQLRFSSHEVGILVTSYFRYRPRIARKRRSAQMKELASIVSNTSI